MATRASEARTGRDATRSPPGNNRLTPTTGACWHGDARPFGLGLVPIRGAGVKQQPRTMVDPQGHRAVAPSAVRAAAAWPLATFAPVANHGFDRMAITGLATPATPATRPPELSP